MGFSGNKPISPINLIRDLKPIRSPLDDGEDKDIRGGSDEDEEEDLSLKALSSRETKSRCNKKMKRSNLETSTNMVLRNLLRPARYFDPPDACLITEQGHTTSNCPNPTEPRRKPCFKCASFEHVPKKCSMGHRDKDCPDDVSTETDIYCLRCGGFGHDMVLCNYEYSEDDLKDIQCYLCKSYGHLCCFEPCDSSHSSSWAISCYRCGKLGHTGLTCGIRRRSISDIDRTKHAEKKRRRLVKALATSAAIRAKLEKKKQMKLEEQERLDEQGDKIAEPASLLGEEDSDDRVMVGEDKGFKIDLFTNYVPWQSCASYADCETSTPSSLISLKQNDGSSEQHSTLHESNEKTKKNNVESEQNVER